MAPATARSPPGLPSFASEKRLRIALGTWLAIEATAASESQARAAIAAAAAAVREVEQRMHPTRTGSDLLRINRALPDRETAIHPTTWQVLRFAQRLHELTDGIFDPCLPESPGRLSDLELASGARSDGATPGGCAVICRVPVSLDLGGIAKGFAVDCAVQALRRAGCTAGLVNAGGDLRLFGAQRERILLRGSDGCCRPVCLENAALAVSDRDARQRPPEHRGYYRRTGSSRGRPRFAAVVARDAMSADALTKCVLLCPRSLATRALQACGAHTA